jgi:hypothetical protein
MSCQSCRVCTCMFIYPFKEVVPDPRPVRQRGSVSLRPRRPVSPSYPPPPKAAPVLPEAAPVEAAPVPVESAPAPVPTAAVSVAVPIEAAPIAAPAEAAPVPPPPASSARPTAGDENLDIPRSKSAGPRARQPLLVIPKGATMPLPPGYAPPPPAVRPAACPPTYPPPGLADAEAAQFVNAAQFGFKGSGKGPEVFFGGGFPCGGLAHIGQLGCGGGGCGGAAYDGHGGVYVPGGGFIGPDGIYYPCLGVTYGLVDVVICFCFCELLAMVPGGCY